MKKIMKKIMRKIMTMKKMMRKMINMKKMMMKMETKKKLIKMKIAVHRKEGSDPSWNERVQKAGGTGKERYKKY